MEGGRQADGGQNKVDGMAESGQADRGGRLSCGRLQELGGGYGRAVGQATAHRPSRVAVRKSRDRLCMIFVSFVLTNLVDLLNLKNRWGEGHQHVVNNVVAGE